MPDRAAKALLLAVGAALVGVCAWVVLGLEGEDPDIDWRVVAVEPRGPGEIRVTFEVDKRPDTTAECQVAAFTAGGTSAGRLTGIPVGPRTDGARTTRTTVVVPTHEEAADAAVSQCVVLPADG